MSIVKILKSRDTVSEEYYSMHDVIDLVSGDDVLDTGSLSECEDKEVVCEFVKIIQNIFKYEDYNFIKDIRNINFIKSKDKISFYVKKNNGNILNLFLKDTIIHHIIWNHIDRSFLENEKKIYSSDSLIMNKFNGCNISTCSDKFYSSEIIDESGNLKNGFNLFRDNLEIMFFYIDLLLKRIVNNNFVVAFYEPYEFFYNIDNDNNLKIYLHSIRTDDSFIEIFTDDEDEEYPQPGGF